MAATDHVFFVHEQQLDQVDDDDIGVVRLLVRRYARLPHDLSEVQQVSARALILEQYNEYDVEAGDRQDVRISLYSAKAARALAGTLVEAAHLLDGDVS